MDALRLAREPPREAARIIDLALSFGEGFPGLIGYYLGDIRLIFADKAVPFEEPLGACAWVDFFEGLECSVRGSYRDVDVGCTVVRGRSPNLTVSRVCGLLVLML